MMQLLKYLCLLGLLLLVAVAGYLYRLDQTITKTFEGRRWSIPALVYAQPLEIYPGVSIDLAALRYELERLGYQQRNDLSVPGSFRLTDNKLHAHLRGFNFIDGARQSQRIEATFKSGKLTALTTDANENLSLLRLEPAVIGSFFPSHGEDRLVLSPQQTPELLRNGLLAIEDRGFYDHQGFDVRGIARAAWINLRSGERQQGGSTLTQQLVKSYFLDNSRTIKRKLRELAMSIILEARFDKGDLLNAYINEIYLAQDGARAVHGFGLGSQFYFNKPLVELSPAEIALLITVIRGPSYYNPYRHPARARERRDRILKQFNLDKLIDAPTLRTAIAQSLGLAGETRVGGTYYPAFMDVVRKQLTDDYPPQVLATEGLRVFTTLQPRVQDQLQRSANRVLARLASSDASREDLQIAASVNQSQTGEVLAILGGRGDGRGGFNRALRARRPVGSLIKPFIYLTAIEQQGLHLASELNDTSVRLELPNGDIWEPRNFDEKLHGRVPAVRALADSLNLATVQLGLQVGVAQVADRIGELSSRPTPPAYPSLLLGAIEMNVLDVGELYGSLASGGFYARPKTVISVLDETGGHLSRYLLQTRQVVKPLVITQINKILQTAMERGTGRSSPLGRRGVAGKTGTSNGFRDSWFAGFDDRLLTVIWVGNDDNSATGLTGASGALRVWDAFMQTVGVQPMLPLESARLPTQTIDYASGLLANTRCSDISELIVVPLPKHLQLSTKPGCGSARLGDRLRKWLKRN